MAKYTITHTCQHTETISLVGAHASREWRIKQLEESVCMDCARAAALQAAQAEAQRQDLPPLHGTPKQVEWAETIRIEIIQYLQQKVPELALSAQELRAVESIMRESSAHQWIEWRAATIREIIQASAAALIKQEQQRILDNLHDEVLLRPAQVVTETSVELRLTGRTIDVIFPERRDDFIAIVKDLGYCWTGNCWRRELPADAGTITDRATELGLALLVAGFVLCLFDEALRLQIQDGTFLPECTRWIRRYKPAPYAGWFTFQWGRKDDLYAAARRIAGSKYYDAHVLVPPEQFEAVLDFAQLYDFQLSPAAHRVVEQAQLRRERALLVQIEPMLKPAPRQPLPGVPPRLDMPEVQVPDEFKDEP